jgi:NADPH2:quinone reductase
LSQPYRIVFRRTGGPEVLEAEDIGSLTPGPDELLIRHEAVGLNFLDTYFRSGLYPTALPAGVGHEAAGIVEAVGGDVKLFVAGDRVGYFLGPAGSYATHRLIAADRVVKLPNGISAETAASALLKGCTAEFLIERCAKVRFGDSVLVHAAAGGVGSILVPWLKFVGAKVIAHAGSEEKAQLAKELGADHALSCPMDELAAQVREITSGAGVAAVLDGVGAASWPASLASVGRRGILVSFGSASGPVPPFTASDLQRAGSIFITRPSLFDYAATPAEMRASADRLFEMLANHVIEVRIGARFPLREAGEAHRALEARATTGSSLLVP